MALPASLSLTHILTSVDTPRPLLSATSFSSAMVGSSRRNVKTRSFRNDNPSGPGRKSFTIFPVFIASSVYLIFLLINLFPLSPVTGSNDPDYAFSIGKADRHDAALYLTKAEKTIFIYAVIQVFNDKTARIGKGVLGFGNSGDSILNSGNETFEFLPFLSLRGAERRSNLMVYRIVMGSLRRPLASSQ